MRGRRMARTIECRHGRQLTLCAVCAPEAEAWYRLRREVAERSHHLAESNASITITLPAQDWPWILAAGPPEPGR